MNIPVWISADILDSLDGSGYRIPVDANQFFAAAKRLERSTLSIGWTTRQQTGAVQSYTFENINDMLKTIQDNEISGSFPITFPVHADIVTNSIESLKYLYEKISERHLTTFTLWSADQDKVDVEKMQAFIELFGVDTIYIDVPDELRNELDLSGAQKTINESIKMGPSDGLGD